MGGHEHNARTYRKLARLYRQASKKEKGVILNQFVQTSGYQRKVRDLSAELVGAQPDVDRRQAGETGRGTPSA